MVKLLASEKDRKLLFIQWTADWYSPFPSMFLSIHIHRLVIEPRSPLYALFLYNSDLMCWTCTYQISFCVLHDRPVCVLVFNFERFGGLVLRSPLLFVHYFQSLSGSMPRDYEIKVPLLHSVFNGFVQRRKSTRSTLYGT